MARAELNWIEYDVSTGVGVDIFVSEPNRNRGLPTTGTFTIDSTDWATQLRAQLHAEIGDPVERVLDIELSRRAEF